MIHISSSLLPDLENEKKSGANEPIVQFSYDNTNEETDGALKSFQQRFQSKRGKLWVAAYSIFTAAIIVAIVFNPTSIVLYLALAFCLFGLVYNITDKKRTRKKILEALSDMNPEEYICTIYPDKIELETIIKPKINEVDLKIDEEADDEILTPLKTVFKFDEDLLNFSENVDSLLLFFNRRQIYCFPKRCMTKDQEDTVREFLTDKLERDIFDDTESEDE